MFHLTRNVAMKYQAPENGGEGGSGGGGGSGDGGDAAAAAKAAEEAAKKAADEAAAKKAADDAAAAAGNKKPTDEEARLLKESMKRKEALDKANADLKAAQEALKKFDGIDADAVRKMLADQKSAEDKALEAKGDWDRLKTRMAEEHGKEITTLQDQIKQLTEELGKTKGTIKDLSIGTQFSQSKFISDELTLTAAKARVIYGDHFDVEDGKIVGYDKPRGAQNRTAIVDQYGNAVGFEDALKKIVEADPEKDHLLKSKMKPGAGSDSKKPSGAVKTEIPTDGISKIASGLKGLKVF
jgi:hypothetical protein